MPDVQLSRERVALVTDAVYEITSLSEAARHFIEAENLDGLGKALCGMLIRIEQLSEAAMMCVDEDLKRWRKSEQDLRDSILGRKTWTATKASD